MWWDEKEVHMDVLRLTSVFRRPFETGQLNFADITRVSSVLFALMGIASGVFTYLILTNSTPLNPNPQTVWSLLSLNIFIIVGLLIVLVGQAVRMRRRRRAGIAGARLHGRMISLFSMIAVLPAILVAVFAFVTLDRGLDYWFSTRTKAIINNTAEVASAYMTEQRNHLRRDLTVMANDISDAREFLAKEPARFRGFLEAQAGLRDMQQALLINKGGEVLMAASPETTILTALPPEEAFAAAESKTVTITSIDDGQILALRKIDGLENVFLYSARVMPSNIIEQLIQTDIAVREYSAMEARRFETQLTFALIYIVLTLVILLSAIWLGLSLADRLVRPIGRLILATQRLGDGDLKARVDTKALKGNEEIQHLATTFNEMASRLGAQQNDLIMAHQDLDERANFTETVLSGVSSGVIGVDEKGYVNHANDGAAALYDTASHNLIGKKLEKALPEFAPIVAEVSDAKNGRAIAQFSMQDATKNGHIIQASATRLDGQGAIITFDDITDLLTAQRNAAWADIARRIAHEIKNPLTPIQLSAERLQAKFGNDLGDDKDIFRQCTETIIRQVEDIGQMVDEFASFARMPEAAMAEFDLADTVSKAVLLQRVANSDISYHVGDIPALNVSGDRRLISQALTNVLKNAEEAVRRHGGDKQIDISVSQEDNEIVLAVSDTGDGWPKKDRYAVLEPYHTAREGGTGLGLSIVKKIIEDHNGRLVLTDAPRCASGGTGASLQMHLPLQQEETVGQSKMLEEL